MARVCVRFPMVAKRTSLSPFVQFNNQIGEQHTANLGEETMVKRAILRSAVVIQRPRLSIVVLPFANLSGDIERTTSSMAGPRV